MIKPRVLIADGEDGARTNIKQFFASAGYDADEALNGADLRSRFAGAPPVLVIVDMRLPGESAMSLLRPVRQRWPHAVLVAMARDADYELAVESAKNGAFAFFDKTSAAEELAKLLLRVRERLQTAPGAPLITKQGVSMLVAAPAMQEIYRTIERLAGTNEPVLITGETGTGKEVVADLIHAHSSRASQECVKVNCGAISETLIEAELFGAVKGSYTGAFKDSQGLFLRAQGSTIFLDEVGEMKIDLQSKLLRVLQQKEIRPVGSADSRKIDCRVIAATNREPHEAIAAGTFREDLYYRLAVVEIHLPPLRERVEEILPLARLFLERSCRENRLSHVGFSEFAETTLLAHDWPGNVRELQSIVRRASLLAPGPYIEAGDLSFSGRKDPLTVEAKVERETILKALRESRGNKRGAALALGISKDTFYRRMKTYGIAA